MSTKNLEQRVKEWGEQNPQRKWAFDQLKPSDFLKLSVHMAIQHNEPPNHRAYAQLDRYGEALCLYQNTPNFEKCPSRGGKFVAEVRLKRITNLSNKRFQVDVEALKGWSAFFDTRKPEVIEFLYKLKDHSKTFRILTERQEALYPFLVQLTSNTRIL